MKLKNYWRLIMKVKEVDVLDYAKNKKVSPAMEQFNLSCVGIAEKLHNIIADFIKENNGTISEEELLVAQGEMLFYKDIADQISSFPKQDIVIQAHLYVGMGNAIKKFTKEFNRHLKIFMGRYEDYLKNQEEENDNK